MHNVVGPTIPRWQLGEELARLREAAGLTWLQVADHLGCSESKIRKIEGGHVSVVKSELTEMLDLFGVKDEGLQTRLRELQRLGKQRGWWSQFGSVHKKFATFLALESNATTIKIFEPLVVPGLLQTPTYARVLDEQASFDAADERERSVRIRLARQERVWQRARPPAVQVILDETVVRRVIGDAATMHEQLLHLLSMRDRCTLQVVPFDAGGHPGALGTLSVFEFDESTHSPVGYAEGQAGIFYLEEADQVERATRIYEAIRDAALSPEESAELIKTAAEEYATAD